jgi:hypothetical protein
MKRQVISIFFLFIISFQVIPINSFFNWEQIEMSEDITEDTVEKSGAKSIKFETCHSLFLDYPPFSNPTKNFILNIEMGQLAQGHSNVTIIPPRFS